MVRQTRANPPQPAALLGLMDSLADQTRLRLMRLLERHELGVADLCDVLQLPQSTVSRHIKVLVAQGWLLGRHEGTNNFYRVTLDELDPQARKLWLLVREQTDAWATVPQDQLRLTRLLSNKQKDSQTFFAGAAAEWDRIRREYYGQSFTESALLATLPHDYVVADLGCGTGPVAEKLARHVATVIAVDNSPAMLKAAGKRLAGFSNVQLRQGDLLNLPIDNATCDAAIVQLVLTYVPDPSGVMREMHRILKPGGRAVIVDLLPHARDDFRRQMEQLTLGLASDVVNDMLKEAGFFKTTCDPLPPEANVKGPALFLATGMKG